jgi:hypothetical protein
MSVRQSLLAIAVVAGGCATSSVANEQVERLPAGDRVELGTAHKSIDVAAENLDAAKAAHDEAKQFRRIAQNQLEAAASDPQLVVARAKLDYADLLVQLREARIGEAEASLSAARADVERTKLQLLQKNSIATAPSLPGKLEVRRHEAQLRLAESRAQVAQLEGDVALRKTAWDERRFGMTASRDRLLHEGGAPPAEELPMPYMKWRDDPRGDVNDTPSHPEDKQSQDPRNNIAPPP